MKTSGLLQLIFLGLFSIMISLPIQANLCAPNSSDIIYVNLKATGENNGTSWADAFKDLQDAIDAASPGDQVWVAGGTYYPTKDRSGAVCSNSYATFYINKNIEIFGGFAGVETNLTHRIIGLNKTILDGDIGIANQINDNAYHVVYIDGTSSQGNITESMILDGFIIQNGAANLQIFPYNSGGGIYMDGSGNGNSCKPSIIHCDIQNNQASGGRCYGGGVAHYGSNGGTCSPGYIYCRFLNNATSRKGGAMYNEGGNGDSSPGIINCTFFNNSALESGGAIYSLGTNGKCNPSIYNCIFKENKKGNPLSSTVAGADMDGAHSSTKVSRSVTQENCLYYKTGSYFIARFMEGANLPSLPPSGTHRIFNLNEMEISRFTYKGTTQLLTSIELSPGYKAKLFLGPLPLS